MLFVWKALLGVALDIEGKDAQRGDLVPLRTSKRLHSSMVAFNFNLAMTDFLFAMRKLTACNLHPAHPRDVLVDHESKYKWNIAFERAVVEANILDHEAILEHLAEAVN